MEIKRISAAGVPAAGIADELFSLALRHEYGDGVARDNQKAFELFLEAAEKGHFEAQIRVGLMYYNSYSGIGRNPAAALQWFQKAAETGDIGAQVLLAEMYRSGYGVASDKKAFELFLKAAEQGHAGAQQSIGWWVYHRGFAGVKKDPAAALQWLLKAAIQRYRPAQINLGEIYLKGDGVEKDEVEGLAWLYLAYKGGGERAAFFLAAAEKELSDEKKQAARSRSEDLMRVVN